MPIKHLSFDVWNTLIKSNMTFSDARAAYIADRLNLDPAWARDVYKRVKSQLDSGAEEFGRGQSCEGVYNTLLVELGKYTEEWEPIHARTQELFLEHPPIILPEVVETLRALRDRGYTMSISSNTNFVSGATLSAVLEQHIGPFEYMIFSDEIYFSKPHRKFFDKVHEDGREIDPTLSRSEIMHVGDNKICDGVGAAQAGMQFHYVAGPHEIPTILERINEA